MTGKIRIAAHVEIAWLEGAAPARCPNCGEAGQVGRLLDIDYRPPDAVHRFVLQVCPLCTARFTDNPESMDYGTEELIEIGWHTYQIQLGAGVWPITAPLTRIGKPAGAKMLEIGGAYGFGLDFGVRGLGWAGVGYDPSPLAGFGARELGLDVRQAYFGEEELAAGPFDVVLATEVVEHLAAPPQFLALMRRAVAADGILLLTTPDAAWITPDLPAAQLMPLLSPGAHVVLQTARSLEVALLAAGFAHVQVRREAMSLVAYASPGEFVLSDEAAAGRAAYRNYLVERASLAAEESDLRLGFAGRGLFEAANDGDADAADAAWAVLLPAVRKRFGFDLETMSGMPRGVAGASLAELAAIMPLGLGMILFGRAMRRLAAKEDRAALLPLFRLAVAAIDGLQAALARRSLGDGLSAALKAEAEVEILLCRAETGEAAAVDALVALVGREPARIIAAWRGLVGLVNAGATDAAATLRAALALDDPAGLPADLRRDALLSLANLALAPAGEAALAFGYGAALEALGEAADAIMLQAFTRLVNAGRYEEALAALREQEIDARAARQAGREAGNDAKLARMVLDLAVGDPAALPGRLAGLALPAARREALLLEAFVRLVNAARHGEAAAYADQHDVPALAARAVGALREDALTAMFLLELVTGDAAAVLRKLPAAGLAEAGRRTVLLEAFVRLVNTSRYQEAVALSAAHDIPGLAESGGAAGQNAKITLSVMDLAVGDPLELPARLAGLDLPAARREVLLLEAYIRLVNASRFAAAADYAATHEVPALAARQGGEAGSNAVIALAVAELGAGDPALVPARLALSPDRSGRAPALLFGAFAGLVNAGRYEEARALGEAQGVLAALPTATGEAAADARIAAVLLDFQQGHTETGLARLTALKARKSDRPVLDALCVDGFVRLVNEGKFAEARRLDLGAVERRLPRCEAALRRDALAALLLLELQPGGDLAGAPDRLEAAAAAGLAEDRLTALTLTTFVTLVNGAKLRAARRLLPMVDPILLKLRPPYDAAARDALFAAGVLALDDPEEARRAAALFARLRDALVKQTPPAAGGAPDPLFWPALRGEILALHRLDRVAETVTLLASFLPVYPGAPDDLREQAA